jgi:hypothetical protein
VVKRRDRAVVTCGSDAAAAVVVVGVTLPPCISARPHERVFAWVHPCITGVCRWCCVLRCMARVQVRIAAGETLVSVAALIRKEDLGPRVLTIVLQLAHDDEHEDLRMTAVRRCVAVCRSVALSLCHCVSLSPCLSVALSLCRSVSLSLVAACRSVALSLCHSVTVCPPLLSRRGGLADLAFARK